MLAAVTYYSTFFDVFTFMVFTYSRFSRYWHAACYVTV